MRAPTDKVVLHALDLAIASASVDGVAATITLDRRAETATLAFPRPLAAGRHQLQMSFSGRINSKTVNRALYGRGLFAADDNDPRGNPKRMIATNLEAAEARRVFPGFDEPAFKAVFELHAIVPEKHLAVSNMPVGARRGPPAPGASASRSSRRRKCRAICSSSPAGELERTTDEAEGVTIGVVGTRAAARTRGSRSTAPPACSSTSTTISA